MAPDKAPLFVSINIFISPWNCCCSSFEEPQVLLMTATPYINGEIRKLFIWLFLLSGAVIFSSCRQEQVHKPLLPSGYFLHSYLSSPAIPRQLQIQHISSSETRNTRTLSEQNLPMFVQNFNDPSFQWGRKSTAEMWTAKITVSVDTFYFCKQTTKVMLNGIFMHTWTVQAQIRLRPHILIQACHPGYGKLPTWTFTHFFFFSLHIIFVT